VQYLAEHDDLVDFLKTERPHQKPRAPSQKPLVFNQIDCAKRGINDLIENGAPKRQRSEAFQSVVWRMANAGLSIDEIEQALAKYPNGIAQKYASRLREEVERSHDKWRVAGGMAASGADADPDEPQPWDDPDTSILDDRRGELPDFPLDALSPAAADWVSRAALGAGVTVDHVAVPLLGIVSSLIGTARRVMPSRSWTGPLTLWTAIVGFSGSGKTPGISATKRALALVERERKNWIDNLQRAHEAKVEAAKIVRDTWKEELKKTVGATVVSLDEYRAAKAGEPSPMPADAVDPGPLLDGRNTNKHRRMTHDFAFSGLIACHRCGCSIVGEIKKQKYVYYHCTGYADKCRGSPTACRRQYVREEVLEKQFTDLLGRLQFDDEVLEWVREALYASHADERREHEDAIKRLVVEHKRIGDRINAMYLDKLDGRVNSAFFDVKSAEWREEQNRCLREIERHQYAEQSYMDEGIQILELARNAQKLFERQQPREKRRLLNFVLSNCSWEDGKVVATFRQPFDLLAQTNATAMRNETGLDSKSTKSEIWLGN
jgi:Protein of unknown function (DUF3987)/Recombinase zinc beta ribbon domain